MTDLFHSESLFIPIWISPHIKTYNPKLLSHVKVAKAIERHLQFHCSVLWDNPQLLVYGQEMLVICLKRPGHMSSPVPSV